MAGEGWQGQRKGGRGREHPRYGSGQSGRLGVEDTVEALLDGCRCWKASTSWCCVAISRRIWAATHSEALPGCLLARAGDVAATAAAEGAAAAAAVVVVAVLVLVGLISVLRKCMFFLPMQTPCGT